MTGHYRDYDEEGLFRQALLLFTFRLEYADMGTTELAQDELAGWFIAPQWVSAVAAPAYRITDMRPLFQSVSNKGGHFCPECSVWLPCFGPTGGKPCPSGLACVCDAMACMQVECIG